MCPGQVHGLIEHRERTLAQCCGERPGAIALDRLARAHDNCRRRLIETPQQLQKTVLAEESPAETVATFVVENGRPGAIQEFPSTASV